MYYASLSQYSQKSSRDYDNNEKMGESQSHRDISFEKMKDLKNLRKSFDIVGINKQLEYDDYMLPQYKQNENFNNINIEKVDRQKSKKQKEK